MSRHISLLENDSILVDEVEQKQIEAMMELMEEMGVDGLFRTALTPRGDMFTVKECVGQVVFRDGTTLNIIPSMPNVKKADDNGYLLMSMIYSIFGMDIKKGEVYPDLFEFFVRVFIDEINRLIVKGMRSKYHLVQGNEKAFKGRIMFAEHIRENYIHKERIYVEYENYSQNRPENRLIKRTLEALLRRTTDSRNIKGVKVLLLSMEEIPSSVDIARDFDMCVMDRNMADYVSPMLWCNIFLNGMGIAGDSKSNFAYTLLIETDALFSAYVAKMSSLTRQDGSFMTKYSADVYSDGKMNGTSVIKIKLNWNFYDRKKGVNVTDAEHMFMSAPGYRVIPHYKGDRLRAMAGSYLLDSVSVV